MDKPASVIVTFDPASHFWTAIAKAAGANSGEFDGVTIASLSVKSYSLTDHQFIQLKLDLKGKEKVVLIPRGIVLMILEGKDDPAKEAFYFSGGAKK